MILKPSVIRWKAFLCKKMAVNNHRILTECLLPMNACSLKVKELCAKNSFYGKAGSFIND